jgi:hypothetical protein
MTQHFAVLPTGAVYSFPKREALDYVERVEGAVYANDDAEIGLKNVPTPLLVILHNAIRPEKPVTRFASRETAQIRLKGVLEVLAKPGASAPPAPEPISTNDESTTNDAPPASSETPNDAPPAPEDTTVATKTTGKRAAKKSAAKKSAAKKGTGAPRGPRAEPITDAQLERVKKMRDDGKGWDEILKALGAKSSFLFRVRKAMKKRWPSSVKALGPGSPNYGKGSAKKSAKKAAK